MNSKALNDTDDERHLRQTFKAAARYLYTVATLLYERAQVFCDTKNKVAFINAKGDIPQRIEDVEKYLNKVKQYWEKCK